MKKKCLEKCPEDAPHYYSNDKKCVKSCGENCIDFSSKDNGIFPLLKNIKNMRKKIYFKTINKNPPKKNI